MVVRRKKRRRYLPLAIVALCFAVVGSGMIVVVRRFLSSPPGIPKPVVQEIHIIRPPPPPPNLPPPPPPPPQEKVEIPQPQKQPDPTPSNEPPPSNLLGLDAQGSGDGDAFGLVGRPGGRDLLGTGGNAIAWYAGVIKNDILSALQDDPAIRKGSYKVSVRLWLRDDGTVSRCSLLQSTGDRERDKDLQHKLSQITRISQAPPAGTPEPITLEIDAHG